MARFILFSDIDDVINTCKKVYDKGDISLKVYPLSGIEKYQPCANDLILVDISEVTGQERSHSEAMASPNSPAINKKIVILKKDQAESAFDLFKGFDDFIFIENLESDLFYRSKFNIIKRASDPSQNSIVIDNMVLDLDKYELTVEGSKVELTFKEFELLKILILNKDKVFSREKLLSSVWGYDFYGGSRTVDVHIRRLRTKIEPPYNLMLKTIRNVGYMFSRSN